MLYFITGNLNKFKGAKQILPEIEQLDIDLPEIQEIDPERILAFKLEQAFLHHQGEFIVDDTGLYMECLNGLPGPLVKWFLKTVGPEGLYKIAQSLGNDRGMARAVIGYARSPKDIHFFEGVVNGRVVEPKGNDGFGWDPIFQPDGHDKTYAEMSLEEKNQVSHRGISLRKLKEFLEDENSF